MPCNKPPKTYPEQLEILKSRGLLVPDEPRALHCLQHHNYYRLSAYRFPEMGLPADWQRRPLWQKLFPGP